MKPSETGRGRRIRPPANIPVLLRRRVGVCVVGVGAWGSFHCRLFRQASPKVDLYVCGRDPERVARVARSVGARGYFVNMEKAFEDPRIQAVSLVLPHDIHRQSAELAAAHGKHALVEKPIATTLEDADAMIEAARRAGIILMVAEDMHFRPAVREAVLAIERGDVGTPLYLNVHAGGIMRSQGWKADRVRSGGGVLMDLGVHYVRAMRLLMGEPDRVFGTCSTWVNTKISGEDRVQLIFSSRHGWQAHMLLSWSSPRGDAPDIVMAGEKGVMYLWPGGRHFDYYPAQPLPLTRLVSIVRPFWLRKKLMSPRLQRLRRRVQDADSTGYLTEVRNFLVAVTEGREPGSRPEDARRDLEIVLCSYEALRKENWTPIGPQFCPASWTSADGCA